MDISLLIGAPTASPSGSQPASSGGSFARDLQQAVGKAAGPLATPPGSGPAATASGAAAPALAGTAQPELARLALPATGTTLPSGALPAADAALIAIQDDTAVPAAGLLAPLDTATPAPLPGDPLAEVRRRMALIEQAGQLPDAQAVAAVAAPLPAQASPQPAVSTSLPASDAQATPHSALLGAPPAAGALGEPDLAQAPAVATDSPAQAPVRPAFGMDASRTEPVPGSVALSDAGDAGARSEGLSGLVNSQASVPSAVSAAVGSPATASSAAATLSAPLASRDWQAGLGQQLIGLHQRGEQHIELHLHPAELGPLSISLRLTELGAQAQFLSAHPQVRAAVEQALPQLREALAAQGISLGETSVGSQSQPQRDDQPGSTGGGRRSATVVNAEAASELNGTPVPAPRSLALGQVDLYA